MPTERDEVATSWARCARYRRQLVLMALIVPVLACGQARPPRPPSPVIVDVEWAAAPAIRRVAPGSDNWPLTWGDDGSLYAAYGDGEGFDPQSGHKLSLGLARIEGGPRDFEGFNIRSASGEQYGHGSAGKKASGMLMVEGLLLMWVRNVNGTGEQCQLAWSKDHGASWEWSHWKFEQFGYCTFINFGRNYQGARDEYVYMTTPDGPSAYVASDAFVLARVPKGRIRDREAYEFFTGLGPDQQPRWSANIAERGPVFSNPGNCRRSSISFNAGLGRYLWWQGLGEGTKRFKGGFGIYDAPNPWGPWTTVFFTEDWDVGPGDTGSFPTKWISEDGRKAALVFSGEDAFSVRDVTFVVAHPRQ